MNKTYRIIYNHHTGTYVAVAENTHARGKASRSGKVLSTVAVGAVLALSNVNALALESYGSGSGNSGVDGVSWGGGNCPAGVNTAWVEAEGGLAIGSGCSAQAMAMQKNAIAIGNGSTAGENAVALGTFANAAQANSVAVGYSAQALGEATVALGHEAGINANGSYNTFVGKGAGENAVGDNNVMTGVTAGRNSQGNFNLMQGQQAGINSQGNFNALLGVGTGIGLVGNNNSALGYGAAGNVVGDDNTLLGLGAGYTLLGSNNASLGSFAGFKAHGDVNVMIGTEAGNNANSQYGVIIGAKAGQDSFGGGNIMLGSGAGMASVGESNTIIGDGAGLGATGNVNQISGRRAAVQMQGDYNVVSGTEAGTGTVGNHNVFTGTGAGAMTQGNSNVFTGRFSGVATQGNNNVAMGQLAGSLTYVDEATGDMRDRAGNAINTPIDLLVSNTVAIGSLALVESDRGMALGDNAYVASGLAGSVALGADSVANTAATPVAGFAGAAPVGVVSVGSAGNERQIQNVAAGQIGVSSTDAINGSQLYSVWQSANANAFHFVSINSKDASKGNYGNDGASGVNAVAIGVDSKAVGLSAFAAGDNAFAQAKTSVAIGYGAQALGNLTGGADGHVDVGAVAIGNKAVAFDRGISIGNGAGSNATHGSIAIGQDGDGSVAGYGNGTGSLGKGYDRVAIGTETGIRNNGDRNISIGGEVGNDVSGNDNVALGGLLTGIHVTGDRNIAIGNFAGSSISASDTLALGTSANASKANSIAMGNKANASETNAIAIGNESQALGDRDVIIGANTKGPANGTSSSAAVGIGSNIQFTTAAEVGRIEAVAVGEGVKVGDYGTGLGAQAVASVNSTAVGTYALANGVGSIAIGSANNATGTKQTFAAGADSIAIGNNSNTSSAATGSMALGVNASTTVANSVALGLGSIANKAATPVTGFAGAAPVGVVSVGSVGNERQIQNVAAGQIGSSSTDAINGSQLHSVWQSANAAANSSNIHFVSINSTDASKGNYGNDGAKGAAATAIGVDAFAAGLNATALGFSSNASGQNSVAIGDSLAAGTKSTAIGYNANAKGNNGVAVGVNAQTIGDNALAIGTGRNDINNQRTSAGTQSVALGYTARADATNAVAIGTYTVAGADSIAMGNGADATQSNTIAIGKNAYAGVESIHIGTSTIKGNDSNLTGAFRRGSTLIGNEAVGQGLYTTVVGNHSQVLANERVLATGLLGKQFVAQNAFTNILGAYNTVGDTKTTQMYNGVAVTVVGSANKVQESNGALVAGYGNSVTNSYKDQIDVSSIVSSSLIDNTAAIADILNNSKTELGQTGVIGAVNKLDSSSNTLVMGMRNNVAVANKSSVVGFNQTANAINYTSISGADSTVNNTNYVYTTGINNTINNAENVIALGNNMVVGSATTTAKNSILLGNHIAFASKDNMANAVSIGDYSRANTGAVAVGVSAQALGEDSIAIGRDAIATGSIATGSSARAGNGGAAYGDDAVATYLNGAITAGTVAGAAFGQNAQADVSAAVALGTNAVVTQINSVALGADSIANTAAIPVAGFAGAAPVGVVSVGSVGNERQIQNVAAGQIGSSSTDAINGSQLYAVWETANAVSNASPIHYVSINDGGVQGGNHANDGALGINAVAIGVDAQANGNGSVALGYAAGKDSANPGGTSIYIGQSAGLNSDGSGNLHLGALSGLNAQGNANSYIGIQSGRNSVGEQNTFHGQFSGAQSKGFENNFVGHSSGALSSGNRNNYMGAGTGLMAQGSYNSAMGSSAGLDSRGNGNSQYGTGAGAAAQGDNNVAMGTSAGSAYVTSIDAAGNTVWKDRLGISVNPLSLAAVNATSNTVSVGNWSWASADEAVAVGNNALANSIAATALGSHATAEGAQATAVGAAAAANGMLSSAFGSEANAYGNFSLAAGFQSKAAEQSVAVGVDSKAIGEASVAVGISSEASAERSMALGAGSISSEINSVALGTESSTTAAIPVAGFAGAAPVGVVSVGSAGNERQIQNVAAGQINDISTDAINGSQLYATNTVVTNLGNVLNQHSNTLVQHANTLAQHTTSINQNSTDITELQKGWTLASNNGAQTEQITAGETVNFNPGNNIAIAQTGKAISIATTPSVAFDQVTVGGVVINKITGIKAGDMVISNVASGSALTDAVNVSQLNKAMANTGGSWDLVVNNDPARSIGKGSVVEFKDGKNIAITQTGNTISIATMPMVAFDQVTVGGVVINKTTGINAGGLKITNVSNGALGSTSQDAVNGSQLYATNSNVTNLGNVVNQHANTLAQHTTSINQHSTDITELQKGWTLASNNGAQTEQITAGETVNFNPGNNIAITQTGNAISIATTPSVAFDQVTVGGVVINKTTGIKAGDMVISNVASGSALTDAVNVSQLNKAMANTGGSWDLVVNNDPARSIGKGSVIEFKDGKNIAITQTGNTISIATMPMVAFDQVTVGGVVINQAGINAGNKAITNVSAGTNPTDAVNYSQLKDVENQINNQPSARYISINSVNDTQGSNRDNQGASGTDSMAIGPQAAANSVNASALGMGAHAMAANATAYGAFSQALASNATAIGVNSLANAVNALALGNSAQAWGPGSIAIGLNAVATGSTALGNAAQAGNGGTAIGDGAVATYMGAAVVPGTVSGSALGENAKADVSGAVALGTNAVVTQSNSVALGADSVANTAATPVAGFAGATPVGVVSVGSVGNERQIQNVAAGRVNSQSTDAINGSQLYASNTLIQQNSTNINELQKGWTLASNNGITSEQITAGETVNFNSGDNIAISQTGNTISIATTPTVTFDQVTVGGVVINKTGINAGNKIISNVAAGTKGTDAVNVSQLDAVKNIAGSGWNVQTNGDKATQVKPSDTVDIGTASGESNIKVTRTGNVIDFELNKNLDLGSTGSVKMGDLTLNNTGLSIVNGPSITAKGIDAGSKTITNVAAGSKATDAVNVSQLDTVKATAGKGWMLQTDGDKASQVKPGDVVDIGVATGEKNITVSRNGNTVDFELNKNLDLGATGSVAIGAVLMNDKGFSINNGPSMTADGINAGNKTISNVATATALTDAVNLSQLNQAIAGAKYAGLKVENGSDTILANESLNIVGQDGTTVTYDKNSNTYTVASKQGGGSGTGSMNDWNVTGKDGSGSSVNVPITDGKNVAFAAGSKNVIVTPSQTADGAQVQVDIAKDLELSSVTTKNANGNSTVLNGDGVIAKNANGSSTVVNGNGVTIKGKDGKNGASITQAGIDAGNQTLKNVADGQEDTDAVNVRQLREVSQSMGNVHKRIDEVEDNANAGTAAAMAMANLPQPANAGEGGMSLGLGTYQGESGYAVGYSAISESGNWIFKASATGNSQGKIGAGAGVFFKMH